MDAFQKWLASTPTGSIAKVALGTLLGWVAASLPAWQQGSSLPVIVFTLVQVLVPTLVNYVNGSDPRYGRGRARALHEPHDIFGEDS